MLLCCVCVVLLVNLCAALAHKVLHLHNFPVPFYLIINIPNVRQGFWGFGVLGFVPRLIGIDRYEKKLIS